MMRKAAVLLALMSIMMSCKTTKVQAFLPEADARVIIYRTLMDYNHLVPITLNESRDRVSSFPAPSDLYQKGQLVLPVKLNEGFLLDRRGLGVHTAFTSYSYEDYALREKAPSPAELMESVIENQPFEVIYDCGRAGSYQDLVKELNAKIDGGLEGCRSLLIDKKRP